MSDRQTTADAHRQRQPAAGGAMSGRWAALALVSALLAGCASTPTPAPVRPQVSAIDPKNGDGLGGTGISAQLAQTAPGDGLGGTGIIGTITGFGSIIVNGLELEFDRSTAVVTDGRPASLDELRIGQVIQGVAREKNGRLMLETLDIQHAVNGPISAIDYAEQTMTVLGQNVRLNLAGDKAAMDAFKTLRAGDLVSVSGLRLSDGTIVASRVDQHGDDGRMIVRGTAAMVDADRLRVGALDVALSSETTVTKPVAGGRVMVSGRMINGRFVPDAVTAGTGLPFAGKVGEVSLEGYAPERGPLVLHGARIDGAVPKDLSPDERIVVSGQIAGPDHITAAAVSKIRTVVTIMKARGSLRPAALRPDTTRPERVVPQRPVIERPQTRVPERPQIDRPQVERPQIERPSGMTGV